jgi:ribulose-phosphate 3-epimerase
MSVHPDKLKETIKELNDHCHGYHIDVMDNKFVPNNSFFDANLVNEIGQLSTHPLWVHLMGEQPENFINALNLMPGTIISFHHEATGDSKSLIDQIHGENWKAGIAINPETSINALFPILDQIEQVLIMSVQPGFSGQEFKKSAIEKIPPLFAYRDSNNFKFRIAIDGGINTDNIAMLAQKGVDDFAVASAIFGSPDPIAALKKLEELLHSS